VEAGAASAAVEAVAASGPAGATVEGALAALELRESGGAGGGQRVRATGSGAVAAAGTSAFTALTELANRAHVGSRKE
jgi:hypothetical protein